MGPPAGVSQVKYLVVGGGGYVGCSAVAAVAAALY